MKITRDNYEAFLLDLSEGNLSKETELELFSFLESNPDLDPELISEFVPLSADENIQINKDLLNFEKISPSNRDYFFVAYHEGILTESEKEQVNQFLDTHEELRKEFVQYGKTIVVPSEVVYSNKEELHSVDPAYAKPKIIRLWAIRAAAACLVIFLGSTLFFQWETDPAARYNRGTYSALKVDEVEANDISTDQQIIKKEIEKAYDQNTGSLKSNSSSLTSVPPKNLSNIPNTENIANSAKKNNDDPIVKKKKEILIPVEFSSDHSSDIAKITPSNKESENTENPVMKVGTKPLTIQQFLQQKAQDMALLDEEGRPNLKALLGNKTKKQGEETILAQNETDDSKSTVFKIGDFKFERIKGK
ncbi:MAG: hypothetical protein R3277_09780 [Brumimicrobium sp.]|nr:hypothetical protein [Brumimicrobium sp.]